METSKTTDRRQFVKTMGIAGAAAAVLPGLTARAAENETVTLALVGGAHIHTPGFISLLNGRDDVVVKYVWDHDAARAQKRAKHLDAEVVGDVTVVWADPEVDAVIVCSETDRHLDLVLQGAAAGKHLFVEKPLGITSKDSYRMAAAMETAGILFTTGYFMRTNPVLRFLKEQIALGNFGQLTRIEGWNCHSGSLGGWFDTEWRWMADPEVAGVGAFGDLGTHSLDILMWMMGEIKSVAADIRIVTGRYAGCDETGQALMKFANGASGTLTAGWVAVANPVSLMISGTEGHAAVVNDRLYYRSNKVEGADGKTAWTALPAKQPAPLAMFVDAVAGADNLPLVTPKEAADRVAVMEAMYRASAKDKWVKPSLK